MTIPTRLFIEPIPGSALYEAEKAFKAKIVAHIREQVELNNMQDAKRSAFRGGPCVEGRGKCLQAEPMGQP